jgi:hypothetical protein
MALHILKMAVGVDSFSHLAEIQESRLARSETGELRHLTRNMPKRAAAILDDGSLYWIIKGCIRARQRIVRIDRIANAEGKKRCAFILDPELFTTVPAPHRPMQGWRYLEPAQAPADRGIDTTGEDALPIEMADELRSLGLL